MTPPWDTDWENVDPALLWDVDVFNLFLAAVNERWCRWDNVLNPFPEVTTSNNPVYTPTFGTSVCTSWAQMQFIVNGMGQNFARVYDENGELIDYTQQPYILRYEGDWAFDKWLFRRWYPREINTLSDAGSAGQKARFIRRATVTPANQAVLSGLYFEHDGTQWVHNPDLTEADQIWDFGISRADGGAGQPASVFGPHILADLHTALKLCVWEFQSGYWTTPRGVTTSAKASQVVINPSVEADTGLLATAKSDAEADWDDSIDNNGPFSSGEISTGTKQGPAAMAYIGPMSFSNFGAALRRAYATPRVDISPRNEEQARAVQMFLAPYDPSLATNRGSFFATEPDDNGDNVSLSNMILLEDYGVTTDTTFTGPVVGDDSYPIPLPWPSIPSGMKLNQSVMRGYDMGISNSPYSTNYIQLLVKWDVEDGFTYT